MRKSFEIILEIIIYKPIKAIDITLLLLIGKIPLSTNHPLPSYARPSPPIKKLNGISDLSFFSDKLYLKNIKIQNYTSAYGMAIFTHATYLVVL